MLETASSLTGQGGRRGQKVLLIPYPQGLESWASRQGKKYLGMCSGGTQVVTAADTVEKDTTSIVRMAMKSQAHG